ncbi:hypothetical protein [Pedobacter sp.]|uniref:hypothetical protein n=1 Tax=Pedobacter sp. TaxID=1411316 RepID=UPI003BAD0489
MNQMRYLLLLLIVLYNFSAFGQQEAPSSQYVIIDTDEISGDFVGYNFAKGKDSLNREAYVLNARYKLNKKNGSRVSEDADFIFTFYIFPTKRTLLKEVSDINQLNRISTSDARSVRISLLAAKFDEYLYFKPLIKTHNKYYTFENCVVVGQAFSLQEDEQYFPEYGAGSSRFQLNLLYKPYSRENINAFRKVINKDSTALQRFTLGWVMDFYDKWFISKVDRQNKTIDFWIDLKVIHDSGYSFGRITTEIKYKIGFGVTDFTIIPYYELLGEYLKGSNFPVPFTFKEVIDIKKFIK